MQYFLTLRTFQWLSLKALTGTRLRQRSTSRGPPAPPPQPTRAATLSANRVWFTVALCTAHEDSGDPLCRIARSNRPAVRAQAASAEETGEITRQVESGALLTVSFGKTVR